jgi:hypothetical protein
MEYVGYTSEAGTTNDRRLDLRACVRESVLARTPTVTEPSSSATGATQPRRSTALCQPLGGTCASALGPPPASLAITSSFGASSWCFGIGHDQVQACEPIQGLQDITLDGIERTPGEFHERSYH